MQRDQTLLNKRKKLVKLANTNPDKALKLLNSEFQALKTCRTTEDTIFALSQIFCVSEATITKDLYAD